MSQFLRLAFGCLLLLFLMGLNRDQPSEKDSLQPTNTHLAIKSLQAGVVPSTTRDLEISLLNYWSKCPVNSSFSPEIRRNTGIPEVTVQLLLADHRYMEYKPGILKRTCQPLLLPSDREDSSFA